ncbi:hypothetical protein SPRG_17933 [Saprolegnia parasitica CBS 223.65]|uniref:Ankyrin repeat domain-containing protein n=1 Tax=Saprolegnia parasitica (strain CBS 223.65) TaxID=695850 RepID=A0A067BIH1_SAPPC|nr:hypothetical protein SPRG_17933 [Saprolegnia parasitica CBS 223.65]KDO16550.1 hypothetical protein SPRG_17933 [Saprolegnia parasitica CBS 223.65]|eukprot:XP_012212743.1 hypothetical protein SPRG_17933 [Saprolegnia parasitica CBS 223.65]
MALCVFGTAELVSAIASFQRGLHGDTLDLLHELDVVEIPFVSDASLVAIAETLAIAFASVHRAFLPWLARRGPAPLAHVCHVKHLRHELLYFALAYGRVDIMQHLSKTARILLSPARLQLLASSAALASSEVPYTTLQSLRDGFRPLRIDVCRNALGVACVQGYLPLVQHLLEHRMTGRAWEPSSAVLICSRGHLDVARYLCDHACAGFGADAAAAAAGNGHMDLLVFLLRRARDDNSVLDAALVAAAKYGRVDVLARLHAASYDVATAAIPAITYDKVGILCFLLSHQSNCVPAQALEHAAMLGRLDAVQLLHEYGLVSRRHEALLAAVTNGHEPIVRYLYSIAASDLNTAVAIKEAKRAKHREVLRYLKTQRANDCRVQ